MSHDFVRGQSGAETCFSHRVYLKGWPPGYMAGHSATWLAYRLAYLISSQEPIHHIFMWIKDLDYDH